LSSGEDYNEDGGDLLQSSAHGFLQVARNPRESAALDKGHTENIFE